MYKVYANDNLLLSLSVEEYKLIKPVVKLEVNKSGSFSFTIYPNHPHYNKLNKMKTIITVYQDDFLLFRGRILKEDICFHNEKQVTCEGELAFLVDSIQRPYNFTGTPAELFTQFIESHNSQVDEEHQFKVGEITVTDPNNYIARSDSTYMNTWDSINKKLIEILGGYVWVRHEADGIYIDYLEDFNRLSNQTIEFGKNLLDINRITKGEDVASALIPLGAKILDADGMETEERLTIKGVNEGLDYIYNEDAVNTYGWIVKTMIWDDVTDSSNLLRKGREALGDSVNLANSIELNAVDLAALNKDISAFHLGTYIKVLSKPHSVDSNFLVSKLTINLMNPKSNKLTLGKSWKSFTELQQDSVKGEKGDPGTPGRDVAIKSDTEPSDKSYMWLDTSEKPPVLKTWDDDTSSWEVVSDMGSVSESIQMVETSTNAQIQTKADEILSTVSENHYLKSETDALFNATQTTFEQTSTAFEMQFAELTKNLQDVASGTDAEFEEWKKYIRFEDGNIILGESGNELILKIQNDRISFIQNNNEVAYFTDKKLYVTDGEYTNSLQIGKYGFIPRISGNLSIMKVID